MRCFFLNFNPAHLISIVLSRDWPMISIHCLHVTYGRQTIHPYYYCVSNWASFHLNSLPSWQRIFGTHQYIEPLESFHFSRIIIHSLLCGYRHCLIKLYMHSVTGVRKIHGEPCIRLTNLYYKFGRSDDLFSLGIFSKRIPMKTQIIYSNFIIREKRNGPHVSIQNAICIEILNVFLKFFSSWSDPPNICSVKTNSDIYSTYYWIYIARRYNLFIKNCHIPHGHRNQPKLFQEFKHGYEAKQVGLVKFVTIMFSRIGLWMWETLSEGKVSEIHIEQT